MQVLWEHRGLASVVYLHLRSADVSDHVFLTHIGDVFLCLSRVILRHFFASLNLKSIFDPRKLSLTFLKRLVFNRMLDIRIYFALNTLILPRICHFEVVLDSGLFLIVVHFCHIELLIYFTEKLLAQKLTVFVCL